MGRTQSAVFGRDKTALLEEVLERYAARYRPHHSGNQKLSCINQDAHPNGDRNPSASVNLNKGLYHCFACGLSGDGYDLMLELEGMKAKDVNATLRPGAVKEEPEWLI